MPITWVALPRIRFMFQVFIQGVLVRDGYAGYTHLPAVHAWCAAHLLTPPRQAPKPRPHTGADLIKCDNSGTLGSRRTVPRHRSHTPDVTATPHSVTVT
jgi:hypothetical protein